MASLKRLLLGIAAMGTLAAAGPCDIYAAGGTACVAAHSTTRALYDNYTGVLYQVQRSDGKTADISVLAAGGVANASSQDTFCAGSSCVISILYDQSGRKNHLTRAGPGNLYKGPAANGYDNLADATLAPVRVNGQKAYGIYVNKGTGYRNNKCNGTAVQDQPEGMYAVFDGSRYSSSCCFDYGNAETVVQATGPGHMEAIYFGNMSYWGSGSGKGPWIMGDLENGLFSGYSPKVNSANPTVNYRFVHAIVKGESNHWAIRGGNAASGSLQTMYDGKRPAGYHPMKKEGAIILGIGGDNSISGVGTFYEGAMTYGYPTDATENAVQANIVAAKYSVN